jgi:SH3-like domain-containing protein
MLTVAGTEGDGINLRITPPDGWVIQVWQEGTTVKYLGEDQPIDGRIWKRVEDPDGNVGWIADEYLR